MKNIYLILFFSFFIYVHSFSQDYNTLLMSKEEIIQAGGIHVYFENFDFDTDVEVLSYVVSVVWNGFLYEVKVKGTNKFTPKVIDLINRTKRKGKIFFYNIKVRMDDGTIRTLQPISVKVK